MDYRLLIPRVRGAGQSLCRAALVAIIATSLYFCWKTKHRLQVLLVLMLAAPIALSILPEPSTSRRASSSD